MARPRVATGMQSGDPQPAATTMGVDASGAASQGAVVRPQGASAAPQGASR